MSQEHTGKMRTGVYPGTFDPPTNGHMDIICRATRVVDKLIVAVAVNAGKAPLYTLDERVAMVEAELQKAKLHDGVEVEVRPFDNLLVEFVADVGASVIVRGLRAVSDFEYEFQMAGMNSRLSPSLETVFLMASDKNQFISSRFVKEIGRLGGDVRHFVSDDVAANLEQRFNTEQG
ncbi:MAG: pantetheine-phosphate adenylyltransferase [Magnetovibrio sp.]|nr:pantetheine-phosphate adenylyltransferase [Magnetovibrio sp.]